MQINSDNIENGVYKDDDFSRHFVAALLKGGQICKPPAQAAVSGASAAPVPVVSASHGSGSLRSYQGFSASFVSPTLRSTSSYPNSLKTPATTSQPIPEASMSSHSGVDDRKIITSFLGWPLFENPVGFWIRRCERSAPILLLAASGFSMQSSKKA